MPHSAPATPGAFLCPAHGLAFIPFLVEYHRLENRACQHTNNGNDRIGIELQPECETRDTADIFTDLKLQRGENPVKPLFEGRMV
jgi:hypothetical protein